jgi:predicted secreted protein
MSVAFAIFTFVNAWCISLFFFLPGAIVVSEDTPADDPLHYAGAPRAIRWKRALWRCTLCAALITAVLALVIKTGIIPIRDQY